MPAATSASRADSRPGGRSARVRAAVHQAVKDLLADETTEQLTIPVIAGRAGVHATTVYRRWGSVVPDTGSLRGDLERYAADLARDLSDPDTLALVRATIGVGGEQGAAVCRRERQDQLEAILDREQSRGNEIPPVDRTIDALLAPLYYRAVFTDQTPTPEWARTLVAHLLPETPEP
jgi:AcrR family transcriptional regulator